MPQYPIASKRTRPGKPHLRNNRPIPTHRNALLWYQGRGRQYQDAWTHSHRRLVLPGAGHWPDLSAVVREPFVWKWPTEPPDCNGPIRHLAKSLRQSWTKIVEGITPCCILHEAKRTKNATGTADRTRNLLRVHSLDRVWSRRYDH